MIRGWLWMCYCHVVFGGKPPRAMIPSGLFDHMRRRGMPVFFLGVNDDRDIEVRARAGLVPSIILVLRLLDLTDPLLWLLVLLIAAQVAMRAGATAVLTDRPQWLGKRIQEGKVRLKCITAS